MTVKKSIISSRHRAVLELAGAITSQIELRPLLSLITLRTSESLQADRASIFVHDRSKGELWTIVAEGEENEIRMPADRGIAGAAFAAGKPLIIDDAYSDERFNREVDRRTGYVTRNMLCFPFGNRRGEKLGVFQVLNKLSGDFGEADLEFLKAIGSLSAIAIENALLYERRKRMFDSLVETLAETIDRRDPLTAGHSRNVMRLSVGAARYLHLSANALEILRYSSLLHDYGKVGVPDSVLLKPGRLTAEEYDVIKLHANHTREILNHIAFEEHLQDVPFIAGAHHERLDGTGYPDGVVGDDIPFLARLIAVADVYDALTSKRYYRDPITPREAVDYLRENMQAFDGDAVEALVGFLRDVKELEQSE